MLACSYIWLLIGVGAFREIPAIRPNVAHLALSGETRGWMWLAPAIIAVLTCLSPRFSWVGVMLLFAPAITTMTSYGVAWFAFKIPGGSPGFSDGWYQSGIYLGAVLIPVLVALFPSSAPDVDPTALHRKVRP